MKSQVSVSRVLNLMEVCCQWIVLDRIDHVYNHVLWQFDERWYNKTVNLSIAGNDSFTSSIVGRLLNFLIIGVISWNKLQTFQAGICITWEKTTPGHILWIQGKMGYFGLFLFRGHHKFYGLQRNLYSFQFRSQSKIGQFPQQDERKVLG